MNQLRRYRIDAGWTTLELAAKAGVGPATVNAIENGGGARPKSLHAIAAALSEQLECSIAPSDLLDEGKEQVA